MAEIVWQPFLSPGVYLLIFVAVISFLLAKMFDRAETNRPPLPPGPKGWPFFGSIFEMINNKPTFRWIHRLMEAMNVEIMCIRLGCVHVITVTSPEIAREFLRRQDAVFLSRPVIMTAFVTGRYLTAALSPLSDQWRKMRKILASDVLSLAKHKWLLSKRVEEADHLVKYVFNQCGHSEGVVNLRITAQHYCGNVIRKLIFGKRFFGQGVEDGGPGAEEIEHVDALFTTLDYLFLFCISDYFPWLKIVSTFVKEHFPLLVRIPYIGRIFDLDHHGKIIETANASIRKYQDPEIDGRIQEWANGTRTREEDLLDVLIRLRDDAGNPVLSTDEIKAQIVELMIATVDNPSNAVEWALAEMINQPNMLIKAWDELDKVVGRDRLVQEKDLPQINYIKACARESFRLHPIAPFNVPHVSIQDTEVCGYFIPKGSHLLLSRPGLGRNRKVWENPEQYDPERHLVDGQDVVLTDHELKMLSFSTGRRGCPGVLLGSSMSTMLFARLLQGFIWEAPLGVERIDLSESAGDLFMAKPLLAVARPRLDEHLYTII